jgi:hypothetical protein
MRCTHKVEVILVFASCYNLSHIVGSSILPMASCHRRMPLEATALWKPPTPPRRLLQVAAGLCKLLARQIWNAGPSATLARRI